MRLVSVSYADVIEFECPHRHMYEKHCVKNLAYLWILIEVSRYLENYNTSRNTISHRPIDLKKKIFKQLPYVCLLTKQLLFSDCYKLQPCDRRP